MNTMKIRGMDKLQAQLKALAEADYVPALLKGVEQEVLPTMQELTPVDEGELKASEEVRREGDTVVLSAGTDHAVHVEFGTVNMSAQPYMRPALDTKGDAAMKVAAEEVNKIMESKV
jgi:HK97 gp10 family phage protein